MTDEARQARNAYRRRWAHDNPDKVRKHTMDYWARRAAAERQAQDVADINDEEEQLELLPASEGGHA